MPDYVSGLPQVDGLVVRVLRGLADDPSPPLSTLPPNERASIMSSLCVTLMRANYHRARFDGIVDAARVRAEQHLPNFVMDTIGKYIVFEALGTLVAARSAVDEIAYIAARRAGEPPARADKFNASTTISSSVPSYPEVEVIRSSYREWFEDVNEYRNALAHRGYDERLGVHATDSPHREASDPKWNLLLLPDRASVCRPKRPHEWSFAEGRRLETLVAGIHRGLVELLQELGTTLWGGSIPEPGKIPLRDGELPMLIEKRE